MLYMLAMLTRTESPVIPVKAICIKILHMIPKTMTSVVGKYPASRNTRGKKNEVPVSFHLKDSLLSTLLYFGRLPDNASMLDVKTIKLTSSHECSSSV